MGVVVRPSKLLLAVLASPPKTTTGNRTSGRVKLAAELLGCQEVQIVNLLGTPTRDVCDIQSAGSMPGPWIDSRTSIQCLLPTADAVLFAWGCKSPIGSARIHQRRQVEWVKVQTKQQDLPEWTVGGCPRHPSRWQRYTHHAFPGVAFRDALRLALIPAPP